MHNSFFQSQFIFRVTETKLSNCLQTFITYFKIKNAIFFNTISRINWLSLNNDIIIWQDNNNRKQTYTLRETWFFIIIDIFYKKISKATNIK